LAYLPAQPAPHIAFLGVVGDGLTQTELAKIK
jgi:hypothetical protein